MRGFSPSRSSSRLKGGAVVVHIGMCAGRLEAAQHVTQVLGDAGIEAIIEVSVMYDIVVPKADVDLACELLAADPIREAFPIRLYAAQNSSSRHS